MTPEERYKEAAEQFSERFIFVREQQSAKRAFLAGCAHTEKAAYNKAIDDAIKLLRSNNKITTSSYLEVKFELEKLKKP